LWPRRCHAVRPRQRRRASPGRAPPPPAGSTSSRRAKRRTTSSPADYSELAAAIETAARRRLKEVVTRLKASHEVEGELLTGDPARLLAGESERGLDLMVVGSRGYGPLRRVLLGTVSANLARTAACPVLVIPRVGSEVEEAEQPPVAAVAR
jgi:nucleotide-binding universal stress UspA family protein